MIKYHATSWCALSIKFIQPIALMHIGKLLIFISIKFWWYIMLFLTIVSLWLGKPELYPPQKERNLRTMREALLPSEVWFKLRMIFPVHFLFHFSFSCDFNGFVDYPASFVSPSNSVGKLKFHTPASWWQMFVFNTMKKLSLERNLILGNSQ